MDGDVLEVISFEIAVVGLMKVDQDREDLAGIQLTAPPPPGTDGKDLLLSMWLKMLAEVIDMIEEFQ